MEITEYERLVSSETEALQSKMTTAIDRAMNSIQAKQSELMAEIKSDPRKSAIRKKKVKLVLHISTEKVAGPFCGHVDNHYGGPVAGPVAGSFDGPVDGPVAGSVSGPLTGYFGGHLDGHGAVPIGVPIGYFAGLKLMK